MRTLGTSLGSGLPPLTALRLACDVLRNHALRESVERCATHVRSGGRLSDGLRSDGIWPALALDLLVVGEESGQMEVMLEKAADTFDSKVQQNLKRLLTLVEPVLILGLGAVIAVVIVAVLMAMLSLNELIV